jgi:glycosyltransferase 2 family protein
MKNWKFWLGVLFSAVLLYLTVRGLKFAEMWAVLQQAQYLWLIPGIMVYFLAVWARAWRWHYMLRPLKKIPTAEMFPVVCIGYFGNNILPARAGEVLRAFVLRKRTGVPVSASLATVIVERIFDGVVMLGFVFLNLPELARLTGDAGFMGTLNIRDLAIIGTLVFVGALLVFLLAAMFPHITEGVANWFIIRLVPAKARPATLALTRRFLSGLESLRSPQEALMIFVTTVIIWLLETGKYWLVMHAFPFQVSFFTLMLMNGIVNLATTLPSAPGYVGTFDLPGIAVLMAYGVSQEIAAGYTLVLHVALWAPITVLGAIYFLREGLKWGQKFDIEETTQTGGASPRTDGIKEKKE